MDIFAAAAAAAAAAEILSEIYISRLWPGWPGQAYHYYASFRLSYMCDDVPENIILHHLVVIDYRLT